MNSQCNNGRFAVFATPRLPRDLCPVVCIVTITIWKPNCVMFVDVIMGIAMPFSNLSVFIWRLHYSRSYLLVSHTENLYGVLILNSNTIFSYSYASSACFSPKLLVFPFILPLITFDLALTWSGFGGYLKASRVRGQSELKRENLGWKKLYADAQVTVKLCLVTHNHQSLYDQVLRIQIGKSDFNKFPVQNSCAFSYYLLVTFEFTSVCKTIDLSATCSGFDCYFTKPTIKQKKKEKWWNIGCKVVSWTKQKRAGSICKSVTDCDIEPYYLMSPTFARGHLVDANPAV